jgi:hypothetical protein
VLYEIEKVATRDTRRELVLLRLSAGESWASLSLELGAHPSGTWCLEHGAQALQRHLRLIIAGFQFYNDSTGRWGSLDGSFCE